MPEVASTLEPELSLGHYEMGKPLGRGGQGTVYSYFHPPTGDVYAAKVLYFEKPNASSDENEEHKLHVSREQHVAESFAHPHLIKAHRVFDYEDGIVIILPYLRRGNLGPLSLNPTQLKDAVCQILEALRYLHDQDFIHRDIKPANILVRNGEEQPLDLVVADYGLISLQNPVSFCGTNIYMAPEIIRNGGVPKSKAHLYLKAVDVYALGILILHKLGIIVPQIPINTPSKFKSNIKKAVDDGLNQCGLNDIDRRDILLTADRMLQYDPQARPSADECLRLPWLSHPLDEPPASQSTKVPSNLSMINSLSNLSTAKPVRDWWPSTPQKGSSEQQVSQKEKAGVGYELRKRKRSDRNRPVGKSSKLKSQKRQDTSVLAPVPTPERERNTPVYHVSRALKESESKNIEFTYQEINSKNHCGGFEEAMTPSNWDEMKLSEQPSLE